MVSPLSIKPKELPLSLPFPNSDELKNGAHMEAFFNFQDICLGLMNDLRAKTGHLNVLDFGSGRYGVGRAIMEPKMNPGEELALYDLHSISSPIRTDTTRIVGTHEAMKYTDGRFNMVNLSYVLCHIEPNEARAILSDLAFAHPNAQFLITDYVLRGREELLQLLDSSQEKKWKMHQGQEEFRRTHVRFDPNSLERLIVDSGLEPPGTRAWYLDHSGMRASMITEPEFQCSY